MAKKIRRKIIPANELAGLKVGLYIESDETIYVSDTIHKLCMTDMELMRKHLKLIRMPKNEDGSNRFGSLSAWIAYLIEADRDIFEAGTQKEIDDAIRELGESKEAGGGNSAPCSEVDSSE